MRIGIKYHRLHTLFLFTMKCLPQVKTAKLKRKWGNYFHSFYSYILLDSTSFSYLVLFTILSAVKVESIKLLYKAFHVCCYETILIWNPLLFMGLATVVAFYGFAAVTLKLNFWKYLLSIFSAVPLKGKLN